MGVRDGIGVIGKSAPTVEDPTLQRAIDTIYKDLNKVSDGVNSPSGLSAARGDLGSSGDIKLYKGVGSDGTSGYFLQGKFTDGWATTRLTLEAKNPEASEVANEAPGGGPEPYITRYGVNITNLNFNSAIAGTNADTVPGFVARSDHKHNHWTLDDPLEMDTYGVVQNNEHKNTIHFPLREPTGNSGISNISLVPSHTGVLAVAARADHIHKLDTTPNYVWSGAHNFGAAYGATGVQTTFNGNNAANSVAVKIVGDLELDGAIIVALAATGTDNSSFAKNLDINIGNLNGSGTQASYEYKTIVNGPTMLTSGLSIKKAAVNNNYNYHYESEDNSANAAGAKPPVIIEETSGAGQLRLQYDNTNYFDFKLDNSGRRKLCFAKRKPSNSFRR